jgi:hypothetical protein
MLTRLDDTRAWFNLEKFEIVTETVNDEGIPCTALIAIIGEDEFCEVFVKENPENIWSFLEKKIEKPGTKGKQNNDE